MASRLAFDEFIGPFSRTTDPGTADVAAWARADGSCAQRTRGCRVRRPAGTAAPRGFSGQSSRLSSRAARNFLVKWRWGGIARREEPRGRADPCLRSAALSADARQAVPGWTMTAHGERRRGDIGLARRGHRHRFRRRLIRPSSFCPLLSSVTGEPSCRCISGSERARVRQDWPGSGRVCPSVGAGKVRGRLSSTESGSPGTLPSMARRMVPVDLTDGGTWPPGHGRARLDRAPRSSAAWRRKDVHLLSRPILPPDSYAHDPRPPPNIHPQQLKTA